MKQYFLSDLVGTGTRADPYRAKASTYANVNVVSLIPSGINGQPSFTFCLCLCSSADLTGVTADAAIDALPNINLDTIAFVIPSAEWTRLLTILTNRGYNTSAINQSQTFRQILNNLGQQHDANFNCNNFDVS